MAASLRQRLRDAALRCCKAEEGKEAEEVSRQFLDVLESPLHDVDLRRSAAGEWLALCEEVLRQAMELLEPDTTSGQVLCEKVGLELPRVVVKFVSLSQACQDLCLSIIEALAESCSPREMFAAFMEALNMYTTLQTLIYCIPLIQGLSLVFSRLQRRQAQFFQEASPGLLALVRLAMEDEEDEEDDFEGDETAVESIERIDGDSTVPIEDVRLAIVEDIAQVARAVRETCDTMHVEKQREDLQQRLGMFALQLLGIAGGRITHPGREVSTAVVDLVELLPFSGLSVFLLLTGDQIEALIETAASETAGNVALVDLIKLEVSKGAALAVYWALSNMQVATAAEVSMDSLKENLQYSGSKGVIAALCVATSLLSMRSSLPSSSLPATGLALVCSILEITCPMETCRDDEEEDEWPALTLRIMPVLQTLQEVVVYAPSIEMRRQGYAALRKVIQEVLPEATRFHSLQALISSCPFPSLVSLLLNCIKDEVARAWPASSQHQGVAKSDGDTSRDQATPVASPFVSEEVLQVVGNVLRPTDGVPPNLPAQIDSVQSALNLYRFILIREFSGKTNYTGILLKQTLTKARMQWLLPLRELVGGVSLGLIVEDDEMSADMGLAMDSLQSVLHRCLELTEEALTHYC